MTTKQLDLCVSNAYSNDLVSTSNEGGRGGPERTSISVLERVPSHSYQNYEQLQLLDSQEREQTASVGQ